MYDQKGFTGLVKPKLKLKLSLLKPSLKYYLESIGIICFLYNSVNSEVDIFIPHLYDVENSFREIQVFQR